MDGDESEEITYTYDVFNNLIGRSVTQDATTTNQSFVYDNPTNNGQMVLAFSSTGTASTSAALTDRFLWAPAVDQLLADETVADPSSAGVVEWALTDNQESVREWIGSNGSVTGQVDYSAFGERSNATGFAAAADVIFGYTGTFYDAATNEDNDVNRWYNVQLATWMSQDPIGFWGGQTNLSEYVDNSATNAVDPFGLTDVEGPGAGIRASRGFCRATDLCCGSAATERTAPPLWTPRWLPRRWKASWVCEE